MTTLPSFSKKYFNRSPLVIKKNISDCEKELSALGENQRISNTDKKLLAEFYRSKIKAMNDELKKFDNK